MQYMTPGNRRQSTGGRAAIVQHTHEKDVPLLNRQHIRTRVICTRVGVVADKIWTPHVQSRLRTRYPKVRGCFYPLHVNRVSGSCRAYPVIRTIQPDYPLGAGSTCSSCHGQQSVLVCASDARAPRRQCRLFPQRHSTVRPKLYRSNCPRLGLR